MRAENRRKREREIEAAAYRLIGEKGYDGMSMLAVARAARASNETLYNWYGDKMGLFRAMVRTNAAAIADELEGAAQTGKEPLAALAEFAPKLLAVLTGERAVALNRAAAADPTGELGRAIAHHGRETVAPLIAGLISQAVEKGELDATAEQATEWYIRLIVGDLQVRRVIGALDPPDEEALARRAEEAFAAFLRLARKTGG